MTSVLDRLRDRLEQSGGTLVEQRSDAPFRELTYQLGGLIIRLVSEYGIWRANVGLADQPLFPASFWITALEGGETFPDPPVTEEDLSRLADRLPELQRRGSDVALQVSTMGEQYSRAMRDRLQ